MLSILGRGSSWVLCGQREPRRCRGPKSSRSKDLCHDVPIQTALIARGRTKRVSFHCQRARVLLLSLTQKSGAGEEDPQTPRWIRPRQWVLDQPLLGRAGGLGASWSRAASAVPRQSYVVVRHCRHQACRHCQMGFGAPGDYDFSLIRVFSLMLALWCLDL